MVEKHIISPKLKKWLIRIAVVWGLLYVSLLFLSELYLPRREINYQLEITFEVDGKLVTGKGVQQLVVVRNSQFLSYGGYMSWAAYGEAIAIDLGDRGTIYALMASPTDKGVFTPSVSGWYGFMLDDVFNLRQTHQNLAPAAYVRAIGKTTGSREVSLSHVPLMVHFRDERDPSTVERVFPDKPEDILGSGVRFISARITITDDPVSTGIGDRLTWLSENTQKSLVEEPKISTNPPFPRIIEHGYFRKPPK